MSLSLQKIGESPGSWRAKHDRIPLELASVMYDKVKELAANDPSPVRVARQVSALYSMSISPGTVRHWIVGDRNLGQSLYARNEFTPQPSTALSYVIGAVKGDGCSMVRSGIVKLEVADREFAQEFNASMARLFSRRMRNKIFVRIRPDRLPMYIVKYSCRPLVQFLRQPLESLLKVASAFPREFLRGFFDAEGHVDVGISEGLHLSVGVENSNKTLLLATRRMLSEHMRISSRLSRKRKAGSTKVIRGKSFVMRRNSYTLSIGSVSDIREFSVAVGFSISRKSLKLKHALEVIAANETKCRPAAWRLLYSKKGGEWVRIEDDAVKLQRVLRSDQEGPPYGPVV